jgi:MFS family permease
MFLAIPIFGWLADRMNYLNMIIIGSIIYILCLYPLFKLMLTPGLFLIGQIILSVICSALTGAIVATISNLFTTNMRFTGMALALNVGSGVFGTMSPMIAAYIVKNFNDPMMPVIYPMIMAILNLIVALILKYRKELNDEWISAGERSA